MIKFGETDVENVTNQKLICRQLLSELNAYGLSEGQKTFLIYIMSLELEDPQACNDIGIVANDACVRLGFVKKES